MERENHPKTVIRLELQRIAPLWQTKAPGLLLVAAAFLVALWGLKDIPFHPDEASYLYMSSDLERLLQQPLSLAYDPANSADPRQEMRARDAPLTRYLLGLGRAALRQPALPADWDWSQTWEANRLAGALPDSRLLFAGRLAAALLLPFSVLFLYLTGKRIGGTLCGFTAGLLLLTNALVLLHARRAMGEAGLLFSVCLAAYCFLRADRHAWLAGLAAALAFSAKQSGLALFPAGLLAAGWIPAPTGSRSACSCDPPGAVLGSLPVSRLPAQSLLVAPPAGSAAGFLARPPGAAAAAGGGDRGASPGAGAEQPGAARLRPAGEPVPDPSRLRGSR